MEGRPVVVGDPIILNHCKTNQNLACMPQYQRRQVMISQLNTIECVYQIMKYNASIIFFLVAFKIKDFISAGRHMDKKWKYAAKPS